MTTPFPSLPRFRASLPRLANDYKPRSFIVPTEKLNTTFRFFKQVSAQAAPLSRFDLLIIVLFEYSTSNYKVWSGDHSSIADVVLLFFKFLAQVIVPPEM